MKSPCDEGVIQGGASAVDCQAKSKPWILAAVILGSSMAFIDGTVVNVALPALQSSLHATVVGVQWVVESYGLFLSALILVGGALGDSLGRRLVFLAGAGLFAAASMGCGLSSTIGQLVIFRCVQGIGAAALVPSSLAIISASFDEKSRGQAIGTWSGFTAITTALGPVIGGWLIQHASWHWVFFINVPLAAAVIVISLLHIPETRSPIAKTIDWLGAFAITISLAGLAYGFIQSAESGWRNPLVIASLVAGFVSFALFVVIERRVSAPMVPFELFNSRSFTGANLLTLLLYAALSAFFFMFPLNLIQIQKYSTTATGAASLPMIVLMFLLSRWSGNLVRHYGPKLPLVIGPMIAALGFLLFAVPTVGGNYWLTFFPAFVILGFGMAVTVAPLTVVVMSSIGKDRSGTASGINNAVSRVAGVLAIAILGGAMVQAFGYELQKSLDSLKLPQSVISNLQSNRNKLGGLEIPERMEANAAGAVEAAIVHSFIFAFRWMMAICACLAIASAAVSWRMISASAQESEQERGFVKRAPAL